MDEEDKKEILLEVKKKKEFSSITDYIIQETLLRVLQTYPSLKKPTTSQKKILVKEIRALLRRSTGMFQRGSEKKRQHYTSPEDLLTTHSSTVERLNDYPKIKEKIRAINPKSILDIGCGLNPLALASPSYTYYACDIRQDEISLVQTHFKKNHIPGKAFIYDLTTNDELPSADLCIIWKVLDIIPGDKYTLARKLLTSSKCNSFIISFSTRTLSGKPMRHKRRFWFEKILKDISLPYQTWETSSELFYTVRKIS